MHRFIISAILLCVVVNSGPVAAQGFLQAKEALGKQSTILQAERDLKLKELQVKMLTALQTQMEAYRSQGKLDQVLAYRKAIEAVGEGDMAAGETSVIPSLAKLQAAAGQQAEKIDTDANKQETTLLTTYHKGVDTMVKNLTQQGKLEEAVEARDERDAVATRLAALGVVIGESGGGGKSGPTTSLSQLMRSAEIYLNFEAVRDGKFPDVSGNGNHASYEGIKPVAGLRGRGVGFSGEQEKSSGVRIETDAFDKETAFTASIWIKGLEGRYGRIFSKSDPRGGTFQFALSHYDEKGRVLAWIESADGKKKRMWASESTIPEDAWTHVAMRFAEGGPELFINGTLDGDALLSGVTLTAFGENVFWLGRRGSVAGQDGAKDRRGMTGNIDEFMMFKRALTDREIKALASIPRG